MVQRRCWPTGTRSTKRIASSCHEGCCCPEILGSRRHPTILRSKMTTIKVTRSPRDGATTLLADRHSINKTDRIFVSRGVLLPRDSWESTSSDHLAEQDDYHKSHTLSARWCNDVVGRPALDQQNGSHLRVTRGAVAQRFLGVDVIRPSCGAR